MFFLTRVILLMVVVSGLGTHSVQAARPEDTRPTREQGKILYQRACVLCHGTEGKGDGPAAWSIGRYAAPRPLDFTMGSYKFRSTPSGELPTDQDLFRTITQGIPGYMPAFKSFTEIQRWQIVAYLKSFYPAFRTENPTPIPLPQLPPFGPSDAGIVRGQALYREFGCQVCHGDNGNGDGPESKAGHLRDARDLRITATDLTDRTSLKNGASPRDLYRSIITGLDGTPMPSYADQFADHPDDVWNLVWYLLSLSEQVSQ
ncbi:MAG: c-type cytochrome [Nitrospira sp.]